MRAIYDVVALLSVALVASASSQVQRQTGASTLPSPGLTVRRIAGLTLLCLGLLPQNAAGQHLPRVHIETIPEPKRFVLRTGADSARIAQEVLGPIRARDIDRFYLAVAASYGDRIYRFTRESLESDWLDQADELIGTLIEASGGAQPPPLTRDLREIAAELNALYPEGSDLSYSTNGVSELLTPPPPDDPPPPALPGQLDMAPAPRSTVGLAVTAGLALGSFAALFFFVGRRSSGRSLSSATGHTRRTQNRAKGGEA